MYPPWFGFNDPNDWRTPLGGSERNDRVLTWVTLSSGGLFLALTLLNRFPTLAGVAAAISLPLVLWYLVHRHLDFLRARRASRHQAEEQGD